MTNMPEPEADKAEKIKEVFESMQHIAGTWSDDISKDLIMPKKIKAPPQKPLPKKHLALHLVMKSSGQ